jgi:serine/threonine protein kinase/formylglycine-generating enzyme required for sulfatase activity
MPQLEKLEHYNLLKNEDGSIMELGHGAMGVTYKAFDTNLQCNVALKVISAAYLNDPTAAERFLREARGAAQLRHRNVASVFHLGRHGESYFYAMEFIEGETVDERVKREGPLETSLALEVTCQVASALIAAHKQGLIHRDIKPSNLMLVREGDGEMLVKLIDFGLVKSALIGSTAGALTSSGFVGTPYFASPEQLDQRSEDIRTDIYSLGITLWFMLTGKPTFMGSVASVIAQHLDKPPEFDSLAVLPGCVVGVLRKMLEKDVDQRLQTPQELREELKRCLEILEAAGASNAKSLETVSYDQAFETIGLSSTHGLLPKVEAGITLGQRYRLIEDLDPVHAGRVFHAEDVQQKRRVRVKIVSCDAAAFETLRQRVAKLQSASHRNFISVLAVERAGAFGYIVSEWLEGFALVDLLRARRELTLRETLTLLEQIAPAADAGRDLGVQLELQLRDVMIHFPEGFAEPDEQVILRCPLAEWPAFVVKLDPLGGFDTPDASGDSACERTLVDSSQDQCPAVITRVAALAYDLLGGKPGGFAPLANVSEEGNLAIHQALRDGGNFVTASAFVDALSRAAASEPANRRAPDAARAPTPRPAPAIPAASPPRPRQLAQTTVSQAKTAVPWPRRRVLIFGGGAVLTLFLIAAVMLFSRNHPPAISGTPDIPVSALKKTEPTTPHQPPQTGQPWKNSLDMRYVPVGNIHFATTETRVRDFKAFVDATSYDAEGGMYSLQKDGFKQHGHTWKNPGFPQSPEHPVVGISYEDTKYFCEWLTKKERAEGALNAFQIYRLPTDREWSEAAGLTSESGATPEDRSEKVKGYAWGSGRIHDNVDNFAGAEAAASAPDGWPTIPRYKDAAPRTSAVPGYGPNARGIYDLGGNVWEWCVDRFNKTTNWRVLRGGSWATSRPEELLLSCRRGYDPNFRHDDLGFRCVIATDSGER